MFAELGWSGERTDWKELLRSWVGGDRDHNNRNNRSEEEKKKKKRQTERRQRQETHFM